MNDSPELPMVLGFAGGMSDASLSVLRGLFDSFGTAKEHTDEMFRRSYGHAPTY